MKIFVDADACPVVGIVEKIAEKYDVPVPLFTVTLKMQPYFLGTILLYLQYDHLSSISFCLSTLSMDYEYIDIYPTRSLTIF